MALYDPPSPFILTSLLKKKCPQCRKGDIFINKHILPLKDCLKTVDSCEVCLQKIKVEANYGQGMNFVFIFIIYTFNLLWYCPLMGLSFKDNSIYYYIAVSTFMVLILQPWLMRFSRVLFLYLVIKHN
jgi:uncharacterized protein (DUF983 family)